MTRIRSETLLRTWPLWPLILLLVFLLVVPVGQILAVSMFDTGGNPTWSNYQRLYQSATYSRILLNTFEIAGWTTLLCVVMGYPIAYMLTTAHHRSRTILTLLILLPFWTSFLVRIFAWIIILSRHGVINSALSGLGVQNDIPLIYNYAGALIGMTHALMPIAILSMASVMEGIPRDLVKAAGTLGARRGQAFLRVYFPLSAPGVAAAAITVFISALGFFIAPALLGGPKDIVITQVIIDNLQQLLNWGFAASLSALLLVTTLIVFFIYDRLVGLSSFAGEIQNRVRPAGSLRHLFSACGKVLLDVLGGLTDKLEGWREKIMPPAITERSLCLGILVGAGICFLVVPIFVVVPVSFTTSSFLEWPPRGFTLKWYHEYFDSPLWLAATFRSIFVGICSAALATVIGAPAAFVFSKQKFPFRGMLLALVLSPMILPRMILAVALFYLFAQFGLVGSSFGLILAHTVLAVPYVVITMLAVLKGHDGRLEQAAGTLGAKPWSTTRLITIPLLRPGLISAFLFAFVISFDELTVALFVTGGLSATLPKQLWEEATLKASPLLAAISTVLIVGITLTVLLGEFLQRRASQKR